MGLAAIAVTANAEPNPCCFVRVSRPNRRGAKSALAGYSLVASSFVDRLKVHLKGLNSKVKSLPFISGDDGACHSI